MFKGKRLFAMQYPGGDIKTLVIHKNSILNLKRNIISRQTPLFPGVVMTPADIVHIVNWVPPQFTEKVTTSHHVRRLPEDSWILWSTDSEIFPVPNRDVKLDSENEKRNVEDVAIKYVQNLPLNEDAKERLIDLFIERDKELLTLFHYFHYNRENFSKQAMIFLRNRDLLYEKNNK